MPLRSESMASLIHAGSAVAMWIVCFFLKGTSINIKFTVVSTPSDKSCVYTKPVFCFSIWERRKRVEWTHEFWSMIWSSVFWLRLSPFWHIVIVRQCNSQVDYTPERLPTKTPSTLETTIKTRQGHHQTNRPTPCPNFGNIPSLPDMAFCCGEETKLGAEAKTPKIQHLVEVVEGGCWKVVWLVEGGNWVGKMGENSVNNWIF